MIGIYRYIFIFAIQYIYQNCTQHILYIHTYIWVRVSVNMHIYTYMYECMHMKVHTTYKNDLLKRRYINVFIF